VRLYSLLAPLQLANAYGLFAVMTTERPEVVVEGSRDGERWEAYELKWKPGDVRRGPRFTGLHLPRLDWLMWFVALSPESHQEVLLSLLVRLLEGEPRVSELLARDPFAGAPPRLVRARLYDYRFTDPAERRATGAVWRRELLLDLVPRATLQRPEGEAPQPERPLEA
jgi:hypothetical protein